MALKTLSKLNLHSKKVLLRCSLDVPLGPENKTVGDDFRLVSALPSIQLLREQGCTIILCGKLGRPAGKVDKSLSLYPVAKRLAEILDLGFVSTTGRVPADSLQKLVFFEGDITQEATRKSVSGVPEGQICVLENLEFYPEELTLNKVFAKNLASMADVFVNDDFAKCHHATASTTLVTEFLPSLVGLQLEREMSGLSVVLNNPTTPFVLMMGGIKISDKAKTLKQLGRKADHILLAGGLANLFFKARGFEVGKSKIELEEVDLAWQMLQNFKSKLVLPKDVVVARPSLDKSTVRVCAPHEVRSEEQILDIGPETILSFSDILKKAKTIVWNGPLGHFEVKPFHHGTLALAKVVGGMAQGRAFAVAGGGETVDAIRLAGQEDMLDLLSTGGGAMLEFLAGEKLPGIEALN